MINGWLYLWRHPKGKSSGTPLKLRFDPKKSA